MLTEKIKAVATKLLEEGRAEVVLGYEKGPLPFRDRLVAVKTKEDVKRLIWPSFGVLNPATALFKLRGKKVALIAPGCASRAVVVLLKEGQFKREELFIIGVPCPGMLDPSKVRSLGGKILRIEDDLREKVKVVFPEGEREFLRDELLRANCLSCRHPTPPLYDELIEAQARPPAESPYAQVEEIEALDEASRWAWFEREVLSRCLRCYACRQACPFCYCPTCFVDDSRPQWVGKTRDRVDTALYHLVRAYHLAGRCVDCGSCEAACPMDIPLRLLTKKLEKEALSAFSYEAGLDLEASLLLASFREDDPEDFMITQELKATGKI